MPIHPKDIQPPDNTIPNIRKQAIDLEKEGALDETAFKRLKQEMYYLYARGFALFAIFLIFLVYMLDNTQPWFIGFLSAILLPVYVFYCRGLNIHFKRRVYVMTEGEVQQANNIKIQPFQLLDDILLQTMLGSYVVIANNTQKDTKEYVWAYVFKRQLKNERIESTNTLTIKRLPNSSHHADNLFPVIGDTNNIYNLKKK